MHWIRAHALPITYVAALIVIVGAVVWKQRAAEPTPITAWSGTEVAILGFSARATATGETTTDAASAEPDLMQNVAGSAPFSYTLPFSGVPGGSDASSPASALNAVPRQTAPEQKTNAPTPSASSFLDPYAFVPRGLISVKTSPQTTARDAGQQSLFEYGNRVGLEVKEFENAHSDVVQTLKDFFDDRANQSKAARVVAAGNDYEALGERLAGMESVPADVTTLHAAFAESYRAVGKNMSALAKGVSDADVVDAIRAYDASADAFSRSYVALAKFFSARGVAFASTDSGAMFTFNPKSL